jgi:hypothetical protein|tara:strand:- start:466 stop:693 length:228 start_codon:yes stop_codon:yes gene_type:complete
VNTNYSLEDIRDAFLTIQIALMMNRTSEKNSVSKRVSGRIKSKYNGDLKKLLKKWSKSNSAFDQFELINSKTVRV